MYVKVLDLARNSNHYLSASCKSWNVSVAWADPEGGGGAESPDPPEKSQKYRVS